MDDILQRLLDTRGDVVRDGEAGRDREQEDEAAGEPVTQAETLQDGKAEAVMDYIDAVDAGGFA